MGMNPIQPLIEFLNIYYRGHDDSMTMVVLLINATQTLCEPTTNDAHTDGDLWSPHRLIVIVVENINIIMKQGVCLTLD